MEPGEGNGCAHLPATRHHEVTISDSCHDSWIQSEILHKGVTSTAPAYSGRAEVNEQALVTLAHDARSSGPR